jgi:hypothetical protein
MGRRSKKLKGQSRTSIARVAFQQLISGNLSSGSLQTVLRPGNFGILADIGLVYELYRFTRLEYSILPRSAGTGDNPLSYSYYPDVNVTPPASQNAAMECVDAVLQMDTATVPSHWHRVPAVRLRGMLTWYKSVPDASSAEFEGQGLLQAFGSGVEAVYVVVRGVCEFKNPMDSAMALARMKDKVRSEILTEMSSSLPPPPLIGQGRVNKQTNSRTGV